MSGIASVSDIKIISLVPEQLRELSRNINNVSITSEISELFADAQVVRNSGNKAFSVTGGDVLQKKKALALMSCPSRVDVETLSSTLLAFRKDINVCKNKTIKLKSKINKTIGVNRRKMKMKEYEINASKTAVGGLDKQIKQAEQDIRKYEVEAFNEEIGASDLECRASDLSRQSRLHKVHGVFLGIWSVVVGLVFAPFTMGISLGAGLVSAGVGIGLNVNNAIDCSRAAVTLRVSAEDKRENAKRMRQLKAELESEKSIKCRQLRNCKVEIENLSKTCSGLARLEMLLSSSLSGFERAIYIAQGYQNQVHQTLLTGDSFQLTKEVFMECPDEFHDEAHKEMHKLKLKWIQLEQMLISNSDRHGIAF